MKKYLVEYTLMGSDEVKHHTLLAKDFDGAYLATKDMRNLNTLLSIKEL